MFNSEDYVASIIGAARRQSTARNHLEQNPPEISNRFRRASKLQVIKRAAPIKYKPTNVKRMEWSS
jgi:hypothetical protein